MKNKKILVYSAIILIVVFLGGYFLYSSYFKEKEETPMEGLKSSFQSSTDFDYCLCIGPQFPEVYMECDEFKTNCQKDLVDENFLSRQIPLNNPCFNYMLKYSFTFEGRSCNPLPEEETEELRRIFIGAFQEFILEDPV